MFRWSGVSTMVWDFVQQEAKCCGADTIYDWTTFNDNLKGGRKVPGSCCDGFPDAAQVSQCVLSPSIDNGAYTKGTCLCPSCYNFAYEVPFPLKSPFTHVPSFTKKMKNYY